MDGLYLTPASRPLLLVHPLNRACLFFRLSAPRYHWLKLAKLQYVQRYWGSNVAILLATITVTGVLALCRGLFVSSVRLSRRSELPKSPPRSMKL
jgi:hypothetical protein